MVWFRRKIAITFINDATNEPIGQTEMPVADLPETFELQTTLHIGDAEWSVVDAAPRTRAEYSKSGSLRLRLRRIETLDPRKILFSLPSICDYIPPLGKEPISGNDCLLEEDDWRQFELVSRQLAAEVDAEIDAIRRIHEQASVGVGWREIHVRRRPDPPISGTLTLSDIARSFGSQIVFGGVSYHGARSRIEPGYSFAAPDGLLCYGVAPNGHVTVLGIVQNGAGSQPGRSIDSLVELAREFSLDLVLWCRCTRAGYGDPLFRQLLIENAAS